MVIGIVLLLAAGPASAREARGTVLVLAPPSSPLNLDSFLLALSLQLDPYGLECRARQTTLPASLEAQSALARASGRAARALASVWIVEGTGAGEVVAHVVDLRDPRSAVQTLAMARSAGVERLLAAALRTLLRARPLELEPPRSRPAPPRAAPSLARPRPRGPALLHVGAGYALAGYPAGGDLRHGPELSLALELGRLRARLSAGYRLPRAELAGTSEWTRSQLVLGALGAVTLRRGQRLELFLGPTVALGVLAAEARSGERSERATLYELAVGVEVGGRLRLGRRFSLELSTLVAGVPLGHSLSVRGVEVSRSGGLELSLATRVEAGFF